MKAAVTTYVVAQMLSLGMTSALRADTITVTSTNDNGPGSLRQALADANDGDTINFAVTGTIGLTSGELLVDKSVIISGPGGDNLTVDGNGESRVFRIGPDVFVTVSNLTITNGNEATNYGGGVYNDRSNLTMNTCRVSDNSAFWGGGIYNYGRSDSAAITLNNSIFSGNSAFQGGGVFNNGENSRSTSVTLNNCTFSTNSTTFDGAGIYNFCPAGNTLVTLNNSTFDGNSAGLGGGAGGGGIYNEGSTGNGLVTLNGSTFSSNSTSAGGGGIYNDGSTVIVTNSTFSSNSSIAGGAIYNFSPGSGSTLTISNSTFSGNFADAAGGSVYNDTLVFGVAVMNIDNTILNAAAGGNLFNNGAGKITSYGYNLSNDDGGGFLTGPGDQINTDPVLGPLQDNGGPTFTHELLNGSPAIDAGDPGFTSPPFYDQRGPDFFRVRNGRIDIGSFEVQVGSAPRVVPRAKPTPHPRPIRNEGTVISDS